MFNLLFHAINIALEWWRCRQRSIDIQILWPICKQHASTIQDARGAFYVHCMLDSAWASYFTEDEIIAQCEALE